MTKIIARVDKAIRPALIGGDQAFTLLITEHDVRALHTGRGWHVNAPVEFGPAGLLASLRKRSIVRSIDRAEARITHDSVDKFSQDAGTILLPFDQIREVVSAHRNELTIVDAGGRPTYFEVDDRYADELTSFARQLRATLGH